ncbi:MAG: hypothetical protein ABI867_30155 [Kofleriaceae bacterium]
MEVLMRALVLLVLSGCGLGWIDGVDDRTAGLPTSGAGPYARLERDDVSPALEPNVIKDRNTDLTDPQILAGGAGIRLWFTRAADPATAEIAYAEVPTLHDLPTVGPTQVVSASEPWEEGRVSAPSVIADPAGGFILYYQGGATPAIGRAHSSDGLAWEREALPVLTDAAAPSAVIVDGATWLFVTRPGLDGIWRAVDAGAGFVLDTAPVVAPRPGDAKAFDRVSVAEPFALADPTLESGVTRVHLWFAGVTDDPAGAVSIGYAASFDGIDWPRFGGLKEMLKADATGPTVLLEDSSAVMVFSELGSSARFELNAAAHP